MIARAALIWDVEPDSLEMERGVTRSKTDPELSMTFKELAGQLNETGEPVVGSAAVSPRGAGGSFAGNIGDVEVDPETGKVQVLRFTAFQDAGKAIHPMIDTVVVEVANPGHPVGVRGVGEASIVPPPAAVANAIFHATGTRMRRLPMNPVTVTEAVWKENGDSASE